MKTVTRGLLTREVRDEQVARHISNGWQLVGKEVAVKAVLTMPKKNTEETPAVEVVDDSEQGDIKEATLKGELNV